MKTRNESIKNAKRFYREIKGLVATQSTYGQFRRFLSPRFNKHSIAWHAWRAFMEQEKKVDAIQECLVA